MTLLARTGDQVKTVKAEIKEPRFGLGQVVADEGGIAVVCLLDI